MSSRKDVEKAESALSKQLIDLGALLRLIELNQLGSQALLFGLANTHQLAIQIKQLLHALPQHAIVVYRFDHGLINSLPALCVKCTDCTPVTASKSITQSTTGCFETLNS